MTLPDDTEPGCGYGPLKTSSEDPFMVACERHDEEYGKRDTGEQKRTRKVVDREFLEHMDAIAEIKCMATQSKYGRTAASIRKVGLKARARVYYGLARVFGKLVW